MRWTWKTELGAFFKARTLLVLHLLLSNLCGVGKSGRKDDVRPVKRSLYEIWSASRVNEPWSNLSYFRCSKGYDEWKNINYLEISNFAGKWWSQNFRQSTLCESEKRMILRNFCWNCSNCNALKEGKLDKFRWTIVILTEKILTEILKSSMDTYISNQNRKLAKAVTLVN